MVVPILRPISTLAPWEVRVRREGERVVLEPVLWSTRLVREWALLTVLTAGAGAVGMLILGATGERRFLFIPPSATGFIWVIGMLTTYLGRKEQAEGGALCVVDAGARTVEIPREHLVMRDAVVRSVHVVNFMIARFPRRQRDSATAGRQVLVMVEQAGHETRAVPLATGRLAASVPEAMHEFARALGVKAEFHDAPDQAPQDWL